MAKLSFWGDFAPIGGYEELLRINPGSVFSDIYNTLAQCDFSLLNLELPLGKLKNPRPKAGPHMRGDTDCLPAIKSAGFSAVGLANNHIMDYGTEGLEKTILAAQASHLAFVGAGLNREAAFRHLLVATPTGTVAVMAIAEDELNAATEKQPGTAGMDPIDVLGQLRRARRDAEIVVITVHGGNEFISQPRPGLRRFCRWLVQEGANIVVCCHSHVVGPYEFYEGGFISYGLGNLLFDHRQPPLGWQIGYGVVVEIESDSSSRPAINIIPYSQSVSQGGIRLLSGLDEKSFFTNQDQINALVQNDEDYQQHWEEVVKREMSSYLLQLYTPVTLRGLGYIARWLPHWYHFCQVRNLSTKLNLIRCESHHEILKDSINYALRKK